MEKQGLVEKQGLEKRSLQLELPQSSDLTHQNFLIIFPILCITLAELLIYVGHIKASVWVHITTIVMLSLSTIFIKNREISRIHQSLMMLPILRLVNLSMPIFFDLTLYSYVFIYGPLLIPIIIIARSQHFTRAEMGLTFNKFWTYTLLSIPLGFLLGLGEYLTIRAGYMIPNLSLLSVLELTFVMVFFVGFIEEIIFRSFIQTRLEEVLGLRKGMIIASLLFGLMHSGYGTPFEMFYTGFVGLFIGSAFQKTRSLPFVGILHGFVNVFLFGIIPHVVLG